jgi:putative (di)nucleoside polyphosphate hydrolase
MLLKSIRIKRNLKNSSLYRKGVGAVIFNENNNILLAKRINNKDIPNPWQMPQGGVDTDEDLELALKRELLEEIGTDKVEIIGKTHALKYTFPSAVSMKFFKGKYIGQEQIWFFCKFLGNDSDINFNTTDHPEFNDFKWVSYKNALELVVDFKQNLYKQIFQEAKNLGLI